MRQGRESGSCEFDFSTTNSAFFSQSFHVPISCKHTCTTLPLRLHLPILSRQPPAPANARRFSSEKMDWHEPHSQNQRSPRPVGRTSRGCYAREEAEHAQLIGRKRLCQSNCWVCARSFQNEMLVLTIRQGNEMNWTRP